MFVNVLICIVIASHNMAIQKIKSDVCACALQRQFKYTKQRLLLRGSTVASRHRDIFPLQLLYKALQLLLFLPAPSKKYSRMTVYSPPKRPNYHKCDQKQKTSDVTHTYNIGSYDFPDHLHKTTYSGYSH